MGINEGVDSEKKPKKSKELDKLVVEAFAALCIEDYCKKLYDSLLRRLPMVISNCGFRIKK